LLVALIRPFLAQGRLSATLDPVAKRTMGVERTMHEQDDHHWLKHGSTTSSEVRDVYDEWADSYDETLEDWDYRAPAKAAGMLRAVLPAEAALLDAGCGTGLTGLALRAAGFTGPIDGIDLSPVSLGLARRHGVYRNLSVVDLQALPLPIPDDSYDALLCVGVMTYVPDGEGVMREFARVVRPGGHILVTQRDDLFHERGYAAMFERLAEVIGDVTISKPLPYLPDNPDFGEDIKVIYATMQVR
jgi:ubiquinone/menaquinone biosynthesis C-methylase UbiE